jgi:hypothetical protein
MYAHTQTYNHALGAEMVLRIVLPGSDGYTYLYIYTYMYIYIHIFMYQVALRPPYLEVVLQ